MHMGTQQRSVTSSQLCDLDTKQTVYVTSPFGDVPRHAPEAQPQPGWGSQCSQWTSQYTALEASLSQEVYTPEQRPHVVRHHLPPPPPPPPPPQTRQDGDVASLLWLLDYRLDHLLEPAPGDVAPAQPTQQQPANTQIHQLQQQQHQPQHQPQQQQHPQPAQGQLSSQPQHAVHTQQYHTGQQHQQHQQQQQQQQQGMLQQSSCASQEHWDATNLQSVAVDTSRSDQIRDRQGYYVNSTSKPPFTYTELIEQALLEEGELTVSGIYRWITEHFGFYKSCDDRWKNSVRHNLSMNPYFRKGTKAKNGSGHLWMLANVEGRRMRRSSTAARMGRPDTKLQSELTLELCEDIPSPAEDIWLCSTVENKENMPVVADYAAEYITHVTDVGISDQEMALEESAERILTGTNGQVEVQHLQLLSPGIPRAERITPEPLLHSYQLDSAMYS